MELPSPLEILKQRGKLKDSETHVRTRDGRVLVERRGHDGELVMEDTGKRVPPVLAEFSIPNVFKRKEDNFVSEEHVLSAWAWSGSAWTRDLPPCAPFQARELKFVSYNVWFSRKLQAERTAALLEVLEEEDAHFVCLQEVKADLLAALQASAFIRSKYSITENKGGAGSSIHPYGCVVLVSRAVPVERVTLHTLPTNMGRSLVVASVVVNGERCAVATVHLESLANLAKREKQFELISDILDVYAHVFWMGDFNFCSTWEHENLRVERSDFTDVWAALHPGDDGWTVNISYPDGYPPCRFDRFLLRSGRWREQAVRIVGQKSAQRIAPSDHYGLVVNVAC